MIDAQSAELPIAASTAMTWTILPAHHAKTHGLWLLAELVCPCIVLLIVPGTLDTEALFRTYTKPTMEFSTTTTMFQLKRGKTEEATTTLLASRHLSGLICRLLSELLLK